jgi:hypothetical protein
MTGKKSVFFVARNFRIVHPIVKDAETFRFGILLQCQEQSTAILNYNVSCSGPPFCYMHFQSILFPIVHRVRKHIHWFFDPVLIETAGLSTPQRLQGGSILKEG